MGFIVNPYWYASAGGTLVYDEFTDTNGTALGSHTPDIDSVGSGWVVTSGSATIESNTLYAPTAITQIDCGQANTTLVADVTFGTGANVQGLIVRGADDSNFIGVLVSGANGANPILRLYTRIAGTYTIQDAVTMTGEGPLEGETWVMTIVTSGNTISGTLEVNGNPYNVEYSTATFNSNTKCGTRASGNTGFAVDNFTVTA